MSKRLENIKIMDETGFTYLDIGEKIDLPVEGKWKTETFVGFCGRNVGCNCTKGYNYQKCPITIFVNEKGNIVERIIFSYNVIGPDRERVRITNSELTELNKSSELSKKYKLILET